MPVSLVNLVPVVGVRPPLLSATPLRVPHLRLQPSNPRPPRPQTQQKASLLPEVPRAPGQQLLLGALKEPQCVGTRYRLQNPKRECIWFTAQSEKDPPSVGHLCRKPQNRAFRCPEADSTHFVEKFKT